MWPQGEIPKSCKNTEPHAQIRKLEIRAEMWRGKGSSPNNASPPESPTAKTHRVAKLPNEHYEEHCTKHKPRAGLGKYPTEKGGALH